MSERPEATFESAANEIADGSVSGGPSTSQTIMVTSLQHLLCVVPPWAGVDDYRFAVKEENALGKQTVGAREWAFRQLRRFYGLDPHLLLFRALRDLWLDDVIGQPLLAMLCALARDPVLRSSADVVLGTEFGEILTPSDFEAAIDDTFPGTYGDKTLRTAAGNVSSSWHQSGHLQIERRARKTRAQAHATAAAVAYALLLGHIQGQRGQALFETLWARVLDRPRSQLVDLAASASQRGLLEFKNAGGVVEVDFRVLLRPLDHDEALSQ